MGRAPSQTPRGRKTWKASFRSECDPGNEIAFPSRFQAKTCGKWREIGPFGDFGGALTRPDPAPTDPSSPSWMLPL